MRYIVLPFIISLALSLAGLYWLTSRAEAQAAADTIAELDAGPGPARTLATGQPADVPPAIDNPVTHPREAFDDLVAAKKIGWPALILVGLTMLLLAASTWVPWLKQGARAFVVAAATTVLLAAGNTALTGGTWVAIGTAAVLAGLGYWQTNRTIAAEQKAAKV